MYDVMSFVNSPFGLLLTGSLISGIFAQYIVINWQDKKQAMNWNHQFRLTNNKIKMDKRLDEQYKLLEEINSAVSKMFAVSQGFIVISDKIHKSSGTTEQLESETLKYNEANDEWQKNAWTIPMKLKVYFETDFSKQWSSITTQFNELDATISSVENSKVYNGEYSGIYENMKEKMSPAVEQLLQNMYEEMKLEKEKI